MQLSRESITSAAIGILEQYGLADVSMRRIATTLGVAPGALYWHFDNKQALIAAMAASIVAPVLTDQWTDPEALCALLRQRVLDVRDGAEVVVAAIGQPQAPIRGELARAFEAAVEQVAPRAASQSETRAAASGLLHLTLGAAAVQQSETQLAQATGATPQTRDAVAEHAASVRFLLNGLMHTQDRGHPGR